MATVKAEIMVQVKCPHCGSTLYHEGVSRGFGKPRDMNYVAVCLSGKTPACKTDAWRIPTIELESCPRPE